MAERGTGSIGLQRPSQRQSATLVASYLLPSPKCCVSSPVPHEGTLALSMPLPKSLLRRPVRRTSTTSSAGQTQRQRCRTCNNLDPRGHASSVYPDDHEKDSKARLTISIDALSLSKTKDVAQRGCRFCNVILQSLDAFCENWRGARVRINVEMQEKATIKVSIDGEPWKGQIIEIYAGSGMEILHFFRSSESNSAAKVMSDARLSLFLTSTPIFFVIHLTSSSFSRPVAYARHCASYPCRLWIR